MRLESFVAESLDEIQAGLQERQGLSLEELLAEYRELRTTVLRLWAAPTAKVRVDDLEDLVRFNEAIDQAVAESVEVFIAAGDKDRELFLGVLGHDLRGPLSTISTTAAFLSHRHPDAAQPVEVMLRSLSRMTSLLDDLRLYTRQRLGAGFAIKIAPVRLDELVRNTLEEIDALKTGRDLELVAVGDLQGEWDAQRLHQALSNLVFNALKHAVAGTPIRIVLDGTREDDIVLSVQNTGPRIPEDMLTRIFDPLVRAADCEGPSSAHRTGADLGLGLYVVREIASAHGGSVDVRSNESRTRFDMHLPRGSERCDQSEHRHPPRHAGSIGSVASIVVP